jgi:uncharacterized phage-like protein YoqJ
MQSDMDKKKYIKANSVALSGHRTIAEDRKDEIRKKLRGKIRLLYAMGITNFYCGMALGFDMLAAEEVISLKVELPNLKLIAVIPYDGQNERWSAREQDRYWDILDKADDAILLSKYYFNGCLLRRNDYMLSHSCGLIAFFDGKPKGGTFYTSRCAFHVRFVVRRGRCLAQGCYPCGIYQVGYQTCQELNSKERH